VAGSTAVEKMVTDMDVELPEPSCRARVIGDNGDDCGAPQWVTPGETITAYTDGVEVGEDFYEDLSALKVAALATLAAIEWVEQHASETVAATDAAGGSG